VSTSPPVSKSIPFFSIKHENPYAPLKPFKPSLSYRILSSTLFVALTDEITETLSLNFYFPDMAAHMEKI
jgi:hypothetical protein